jgi:hypothetical protein
MRDQSRSQRIQEPPCRDASRTTRPSGGNQSLGRSRSQGQLQRLLATLRINADDCFGPRFALQAAEQGARCLTAKRRISGQYHDRVS